MKRRIIKDKTYGYFRIDPLPSEQELDYFYKKRYYMLIKKGGRAPEIRKTLRGGEIAKKEAMWLAATLYQEIEFTLRSLLAGRPGNLLDIGCGRGEFMQFMMNSGWNTTGIEPSEHACAYAGRNKLTIYKGTLNSFLAEKQREFKNSFDAVTLINVLEHVINPEVILDTVKKLVKPRSGVIVIKVPNDFSLLQKHAERETKKKRWWVAMPDHINYFNMESLQTFLQQNGFEIIDKTADFPMEFFLLMGEDYTSNRKIGSLCHKKRVNFEASLPYPVRRMLYRKLADIGMGRDCIVYARGKKQ